MRLRGDSGSEKMSVQDRIATERPGETGVAARCPRAPRTNLLLAATVRTDFGGAPVRIRNLSEGGAMVEGAALPAVGERLTLSRAQLAVGATVAWRTGDRCGVRFDRTVSVAQWAAGLKLPTGQAEVDAMQAAVRSGAAPTPSPAPDAVVREEVEQRIAEEIGLVARLIEWQERLLPLSPPSSKIRQRRTCTTLKAYQGPERGLLGLCTEADREQRTPAPSGQVEGARQRDIAVYGALIVRPQSFAPA